MIKQTRVVKRFFDIGFSFISLLFFGWLIVLGWLIAAITTGNNGFFYQKRVGQYGRFFTIIKLRTMCNGKVTRMGAFFRKTKMDELPQLINVLKGEMSVVGPRPDIAGYYDCLEGEDRKVLELKPGLTSEASLKYYDEEALLALQEHPLQYNDLVLFPDKVRLNLEYYYKHTFFGDIKIIAKTLFHKFL